MEIDLNSFNALKPFIYSKILFVPELNNPSVKVCVGIVVYSEETEEYQYRRTGNHNPLISFADSMMVDILNDFFTDFPSLEYLYNPESGTGLEKYPNWLTAVSHEINGVVRLTKPLECLSSSLSEALEDIFTIETSGWSQETMDKVDLNDLTIDEESTEESGEERE